MIPAERSAEALHECFVALEKGGRFVKELILMEKII